METQQSNIDSEEAIGLPLRSQNAKHVWLQKCMKALPESREQTLSQCVCSIYSMVLQKLQIKKKKKKQF